ncbi:MAG: NAD(P)H-hydrate dehydratase [Marinilabiliaceae bacterium]|nr:NAD(P)H-hydrate dehydratase [Marinilabiliaceae bacterium]
MKIFPTETIRTIDEYTIQNEPILSIDLMERAAQTLFLELTNRFADRPFLVLAGAGNNGGDALAIARMLILEGFDVITIMLKSDNLSPDASENKRRLTSIENVKILIWEENQQLPEIADNCVILDGLFGTGLTRPLSDNPLNLILQINKLKNEIVSIDIPSGLMCDNNGENNPEGIIKATYTYSFQFVKLAFLFPENQKYVGKWQVLDIGLNLQIIAETLTNFHITDFERVKSFFVPRKKFDHKGNFGHALLIAGSAGKMGAAILASKACLRSGAGLLTVHIPQKIENVFHISVPEVMVSFDKSEQIFSTLPDLTMFSAIGIGPGIGTHSTTAKAIGLLFRKARHIPYVIDADAINILSINPKLIDNIPNKSILTPHPKEFERLAGKWENDYQKVEMALNFCYKKRVILVLKGAYTAVIFPNGRCNFNPSGNPGMATAGSGDVLTGIILALLAQGLSPEKASIAGTYIHGLAGDFAREVNGETSLIASDIVSNLGKAFQQM